MSQRRTQRDNYQGGKGGLGRGIGFVRARQPCPHAPLDHETKVVVEGQQARTKWHTYNGAACPGAGVRMYPRAIGKGWTPNVDESRRGTSPNTTPTNTTPDGDTA